MRNVRSEQGNERRKTEGQLSSFTAIMSSSALFFCSKPLQDTFKTP